MVGPRDFSGHMSRQKEVFLTTFQGDCRPFIVQGEVAPFGGGQFKFLFILTHQRLIEAKALVPVTASPTLDLSHPHQQLRLP